MSHAEWIAHEKKFVDRNFYNFVGAMMQTGEIIEQKDDFHGDHVRWNVQFRDQQALEKWQREVAKLNLVNERTCADLGFKLETIYS
jgi:hypothetical protein